MDRRTALRSMAAAALCGPTYVRSRHRLFPGFADDYSERCIRLVRESTVVDLLSQFRFADYRDGDLPTSRLWLDDPDAFTEGDWAVFQESGVDTLALGHGPGDFEGALRHIARWNGFLASNGRRFARIDSGDDFARARDAGKVGVILSYQDSTHFRSPDDVETFHQLGQRISQLTYNYQNLLGAGFLEHQDGGLTVFGHQILERMQEVGMAVDLSHCGDRTTLDALAAATRPVIFTHANPRAVLPGHLRNKTDEAIRGMAATGGVMGINFIRFMVRGEPPVGVDDVMDHVDHVVRLVGVEHVALGSDLDLYGNASPRRPPDDPPNFDGRPNFDRYGIHLNEENRETITDLDHPKRVFDFTEGLIRRGYGDEDIGAMLGGNAVRVLGEVWA
ncbi:MAG TPA: membrane dipeptidase [Longimicrobiales bacterium]|nr:membrane dipeptidase [Longimicrobiales bacterium]